jgi:hypothetical protein
MAITIHVEDDETLSVHCSSCGCEIMKWEELKDKVLNAERMMGVPELCQKCYAETYGHTEKVTR